MATGKKMGAPRKPTELKILQGQKYGLPENEVKPNPNIPEMPDWLHPYAKEEWKSLAIKLERLGLLTEIDGAVFAAYCQSYARWREAEEMTNKINSTVFKTPSGYMQQTPYVVISQKERQLIAIYLSKLGLSPSDRAGLTTEKQNEKKSKLTGLLSG